MVYAGRGGRFEMVTADRAVNQRADQRSFDASGTNRLLGASHADLARQGARRPKPPLADAAHQFESSLGQPQPLVQRREPAFDLGGRDDFVRQGVAERFEADVLVTHSGGHLAIWRRCWKQCSTGGSGPHAERLKIVASPRVVKGAPAGRYHQKTASMSLGRHTAWVIAGIPSFFAIMPRMLCMAGVPDPKYRRFLPFLRDRLHSPAVCILLPCDTAQPQGSLRGIAIRKSDRRVSG